MSPVNPARGKKMPISDNLYTALLAITFLVVSSAAGLVTYMCYTHYEKIFTIANPW